ncbi:hypothetical protein ACQEVB_12100 [Pseudonocardia sp. CA-107938]|uniref:hypothetical protein n=1 Tax=Pseudonocardia sp. CA-107938 TaxID=3240021 RepID=UPI003D8EB8F1
MPDETRDDCIREAARLVAGQAGAAELLLDIHVADRSGRCRGCRQHDRPTPLWPCVLVAIARCAAERTNPSRTTLW